MIATNSGCRLTNKCYIVGLWSKNVSPTIQSNTNVSSTPRAKRELMKRGKGQTELLGRLPSLNAGLPPERAHVINRSPGLNPFANLRGHGLVYLIFRE